MNLSRMINAIGTHSGGPGIRVIVSGLGRIPGKTMGEKRDFVKRNMDHVRTMLCCEPRGHGSVTYCPVITEPTQEEADAGVIWMGAMDIGYDNMSGGGTISVVTALVETGIVPMVEPVTEVVLDTPAGLVRARASVARNRVESVTLQNVPSFVVQRNAAIDVEGLGTIRLDVAYGGNWLVYVRAEDLGVEIRKDALDGLLDVGTKIKDTAEQCLELRHPNNRALMPKLTGAMIYEERGGGPDRVSVTNIVVEGKHFFDRCPCGTGTSGLVALLFEDGRLHLGDILESTSILGSQFDVKIKDVSKIAGRPAVIPEITGSAYITGFHQYVVDPEDPFKDGFTT